jgi:Transposase IS116/IS110/IS902 family
MHQVPLVEEAMGRQALALLRLLDAACTSAGDLEQATTQSFNQHPDAGIITSFPGLGPLTGARVLAETGDDRSRFADAKGLKAYAGPPPSPAPAANPSPSCTAESRTSAWPPPDTSGPSPRSPPHPAPAPTTTAAEKTATATPPPSATSSEDSSAACTTA